MRAWCAIMDQENAAAHVIGESIGYGERSGKNVCGHDERADPPEEEQGHDPEGLQDDETVSLREAL